MSRYLDASENTARVLDVINALPLLLRSGRAAMYAVAHHHIGIPISRALHSEGCADHLTGIRTNPCIILSSADLMRARDGRSSRSHQRRLRTHQLLLPLDARGDRANCNDVPIAMGFTVGQRVNRAFYGNLAEGNDGRMASWDFLPHGQYLIVASRRLSFSTSISMLLSGNRAWSIRRSMAPLDCDPKSLSGLRAVHKRHQVSITARRSRTF